MRLMRVDKLEDCFDGSSACSYQFDQPWTREAIQPLEALGELAYFADFPRPFYRVCAGGKLQISGVEGLAHWRVVASAERHAWLQQVLAQS